MAIRQAIRRPTFAAAVLAGALAWAGSADGALRPRPSDVSPAAVETAVAPNPLQVFNDYATPERTYCAREAVVHYVVTGIDAPPLNDDDGDSVPDYVERVGDAADAAVGYYAARRFARIRPDEGGPDASPDLYVSRFTPGVFGAAIPNGAAAGGAFAVVANTLDPSAERSLGSLYGTVAHEVFHLVQFSYYALNTSPEVPQWVLEGSAAAMERRVYPELDDIVSILQTDLWLAAPQRSLSGASYGAQLFWRYIDERVPQLLPAYLRRLASHDHTESGVPELAETFRRVTEAQLGPTFHRFAVDVARDHAGRFAEHGRLRRRHTRVAHVPAFGVQYIRIGLPRRRSAPIVVAVASSRGALVATLTYRVAAIVPGDPAAFVRVRGVRHGRGLRFTLPARVVSDLRVFGALLTVTAARPTAAATFAVRVR
jgi:hypothetical protein